MSVFVIKLQSFISSIYLAKMLSCWDVFLSFSIIDKIENQLYFKYLALYFTGLEMNPLYTAKAHTHGGRNGHVESNDGLLKLDLAMPKELGGTGNGTNPEQLFAAGYAACFESAMRYVAMMDKIALQDVEMSSEVSLYPLADKSFKLGVKLHAKVVGLDQKEAEELIHKAHHICPYSNAIRDNVEVDLSVSVE